MNVRRSQLLGLSPTYPLSSYLTIYFIAQRLNSIYWVLWNLQASATGCLQPTHKFGWCYSTGELSGSNHVNVSCNPLAAIQSSWIYGKTHLSLPSNQVLLHTPLLCFPGTGAQLPVSPHETSVGWDKGLCSPILLCPSSLFSISEHMSPFQKNISFWVTLFSEVPCACSSH